MTDLPVIVGTGSRAFLSHPAARAALLHASGGAPALLRVGDAYGADKLLRAAAGGLGWPRPDVKQADWPRWCPACRAERSHRRHRGGLSWCPTAGFDRNNRVVAEGPPATAGVALFAAALRNRGTLDCAGKILAAGIPISCWCDQCGPAPLTAPCGTHSLAEVLGEWEKRGRDARQAARA